jgi:hypothetical protein
LDVVIVVVVVVVVVDDDDDNDDDIFVDLQNSADNMKVSESLLITH